MQNTKYIAKGTIKMFNSQGFEGAQDLSAYKAHIQAILDSAALSFSQAEGLF